MCGIAGILGVVAEPEGLRTILLRMQTELRHRGPDDKGIFLLPQDRGGMVHTRLAILDPSPSGHQPMSTSDGRCTITFNGEIYNFRDLRRELEADGEVFSSQSDTEVLLKMYRKFGPDCVRKLDGMFAFAIWDNELQSCVVARDPLGIKPLYYCEHDGMFCFASEMRALLASDVAPKRLCVEAVRGYLLSGSVQEPLTLAEGVRCLPAGHYLVWEGGQAKIVRYWDIKFGVAIGDEQDAKATVREALLESVKRHFVSDVPVGIFLSGGIDSTALVALARQVGQADLRTFCISFDNSDFDEGGLARRTASHFGTRHHDWRLDAPTARKLLQEFLERSDQPSVDGFNTFCVAKHAHDQGAKVVLSGLGGDELFGGYPSFRRVPRLIKTSGLLGGRCRKLASWILDQQARSPRLRRLGNFLAGSGSAVEAYTCCRGIFTPPEAAALIRRYLCDERPAAGDGDVHQLPAQPTLEDEVSFLELTRYMRNQLLRDSDVMSMAWGLELRVPFVDRKLVETIAPITSALRLARGKRLLVNAVPEIPQWVINHPKRGFSFPFEEWIAQEWRDVFSKIETESPVPLHNWYRRWCVFALEHALGRLGLC